MTKQYIACLGDYQFSRIADYAKKRYIDGISTMVLMNQATSEKEREEIALVCLLDIEDSEVKSLKLTCKYATECKIDFCRDVLRKMIQDLAVEH